MKFVISFLCCLMVFNFVRAENVHYGDYTTPGVITPDLVIIGGNLDLKDSFTVQGDLKIVGGKILIESDNSSTRTVDLYVDGDLIVTNTNDTGELDASISIPTGRLIVAGEIFTHSDESDAYVSAKYGMKAGRIEASGLDSAYIESSNGSIEVEEDIFTKSDFSGHVRAYHIRAGAIYTNGKGTTSSYVYADGSIDVRGEIITRCEEGPAYVKAAETIPGDLKAGSIYTNGYSGSYIECGDTGVTGNISVANDIVTTSSFSTQYVDANGYIEAANISTHGYSHGFVKSTSYIDVLGDITTFARHSASDASVTADSYIKAKNISARGGVTSRLTAGTYLSVRGSIVLESSGATGSNIQTTAGDLKAGSISISTASGLADVDCDGGDLLVDGTIYIKSTTSTAEVLSQGHIKARSIFADGSAGARVMCSNSDSDIIVKDDIKTKSSTGNAYVSTTRDIEARSISTEGTIAYVTATNGSITVREDIKTNASTGASYVKAPSGDINAQKIQTIAAVGQDDAIEAASGSAHFQFVPTQDDAAITIKDSEFSFDRDQEWKTVMTIKGTCTIDGNGHVLTLGSGGGITVDASATLYLKNINLHKVSAQVVKCTDNTGTIKVDNVVWKQSQDTEFANGKFEVVGDFVVKGPGTEFAYQSTQVSTISSDSSWSFCRGVTLKYNTGAESRIAMTDESSRFVLDGAILELTQNMRLTKGTLGIENKIYIDASPGRNLYYGNTVLADNLHFDKNVDSWLKVDSVSIIVNENV